MQLNTLVITERRGDHLNSFALELEYRLAGLKALFEANITRPKDQPGFKEIVFEFLSRGGQIHYVIDPDDRVLGSAYVLTSHSLLQNLYPVERFFIENQDIDPETQAAVADCLLASIVKTAETEIAEHSHAGSIWIQLTFPQGALVHPEDQPIYGALEANQFRGIGAPQAELWIRLIEELVPVEG